MFAHVVRFANSVFRGRGQSTAPPRSESAPVDVQDEPAEHSDGLESPREQPAMELGGTADTEAELDQLRQRLEAIRAQIEREHAAARQLGLQASPRVLASLRTRAELLQRRMRRVAGEIEEQEASRRRPPLRSVARRSWSLPRTAPAAAGGGDRSLGRAASAAAKRGRFASAAERATFVKIAAELAQETMELQWQALERLGELRTPVAAPVLAAAVHHAREEIRVAGVKGLATLGGAVARSGLVEALADPSHRVRVWAVRGLAGNDDVAVDKLLCAALRDGHAAVRRAAATSLGWRQLAMAERPLLGRLHDDSGDVRVAAASALGSCGSRAAVFELIGALSDDVLPVRQAALASLEKLLGSAPAFAVEAERDARDKAVGELRAWWRSERVRRLVGEAAPVPAPVTEAQLDAPAAAEEPSATAAGGEPPASLDAPPEEPALGDTSLDGKPDLEGGLDGEVGGDFVQAADAPEAKP